MLDIVIKQGEPASPLWIDITSPTQEELRGLAERYHLHETNIEDCMQPEHLPKHEKFGDTTFIIVRAYDECAPEDSDDVQSMTVKVAIFLGNRFLLSVHRPSLDFLTPVREKYRNAEDEVYLQMILLEMLLDVVETYHKPLEEMELRLDRFENTVLRDRGTQIVWEEIFRIKCRLSVIKRMLWHLLNTVQKFVPHSAANMPMCQDLRERIENLQFFADSLLDDLNNLMHVQMSLASQKATEASNRTNEVMKILAMFSAVFLPITFLVGVYGMNFRHMPELEHRYGYFGVWAVIFVSVVTIYLWFRKKRWI